MYDVKPGDTFDGISRKLYGTSDHAATLKAANPGAGDPPQPGASLFTTNLTPRRPTSPSDLVSISIDGQTFTGWTQVGITRSMDAFSSFIFESVWSPDDRAHRRAFRPFRFRDVVISDGADALLTGTLIDATPNVTETSSTVTVSGSSLPGVLDDCTAPASALPLDGDRQTLGGVASALLRLFGLTLDMPDPGPAFDRESISPEEKVLDYLTRLAGQRGKIITDTTAGACRIYSETSSPPVATLAPGDYTSVSPRFQAREYYSSITGRAPTSFQGVDDEPGSVFTAPNPKLPGRARPYTFKASEAEAGTLPEATRAKLGRMHGNAVEYTVAVNDWRTKGGRLWSPGDRVIVHAPEAMVYSPYTFLIREVRYAMDAKTKTAELSLVLPGAFNGAVPESMPWE
jgi:prophage tail gpP-like protein